VRSRSIKHSKAIDTSVINDSVTDMLARRCCLVVTTFFCSAEGVERRHICCLECFPRALSVTKHSNPLGSDGARTLHFAFIVRGCCLRLNDYR